MSQSVIQTQNLGKTFGTFPALTDLSINIEQGITTGLVGPNGAGKTTLFSLLCGFLQPTKGSIQVLGLPPSHPGLKGRVSILPQDASFLKALAVGKQL
ncbi:MAG: ATP-binding cassette domain-containing protein, partial [Proteobacteria bacterium]|nr:ATP-binding cassette domain-containing protein [Pseudomonadota bacterium]